MGWLSCGKQELGWKLSQQTPGPSSGNGALGSPMMDLHHWETGGTVEVMKGGSSMGLVQGYFQPEREPSLLICLYYPGSCSLPHSGFITVLCGDRGEDQIIS